MTEISAKIKKDPNNLAQRIRCGYCFNPIAQGGDFKEYDIKGRKFADGSRPVGLMCEDCQAFPERIKEGPRLALTENANGELIETPANNIPETEPQDELAVTATGMFVRRDEKGKLKKVDKDEEIEMSGTIIAPSASTTLPGGATHTETRVETEVRRAARRER